MCVCVCVCVCVRVCVSVCLCLYMNVYAFLLLKILYYNPFSISLMIHKAKTKEIHNQYLEIGGRLRLNFSKFRLAFRLKYWFV